MIVSGFLGIVLGVVNVLGISSVLRGGSFMMFRDEKSAFITAFVICLAMCSIGINNMLKNADFRIAGFVIGGLVGLILLVTFIFVVSGKPVPVVGSLRNSLILLLVLMCIKLSVSTINIVSMTGGRV